MEQAATADTQPLAGPLPEVSGLLDGLPRQRVQTASAPSSAAPARPVEPRTGLRPWRVLPTPSGTPFTFGFAAVLLATSLISTYASSSLVYALQQGSSTDVAHLIRTPVLVLLASALWVAGGLVSPYVLCFLVVLTALERRIGGARTAVVFLVGHVLATLATEGGVGLGVLFGDLPHTSLHRLDYGISFGVASSVGALAGLLTPWLRWPLLVLFGGMLIQDLIAYTDPMTNWGHLISLAIGVSCWPKARHWHQAHKTETLRAPHPQPA